MDETTPASPSPFVPPPPAASEKSVHTKIFVGPDGPRAGWRLLFFLGVLAVIFAAETEGTRLLLHHQPSHGVALTPGGILLSKLISFVDVLVASAIMAKIEKRKIADYGLPWERTFGVLFWKGAAIGFAGISALLGAMRLAGVAQFGPLALHGGAILKYGMAWGIAFLCVGFFEEFGFRGYILFTLTTGIEFWPAAVLCSLVFGYVHHGNAGETWLGAFNAGFVGLLFCLMLRRTGDLWMAIGFHAAWDWGESYFYGVADSGQLVPGHLLNASFSGQPWLSGGSVGPEGSWLCTILLMILWFFFFTGMKEVRYPSAEAVAAGRGPVALRETNEG